jgi:hypothetical protein
MTESYTNDGSTVAKHLKDVVEAVKQRGRKPAGTVTARVGTHPKVTTVYEPNPPVDTREMYVWAETETAYHKVEFGRRQGHAVASYLGSFEKGTDTADRVEATLSDNYHKQPPIVAAAAGGEL